MTLGRDRTIRFWDAATGKQFRQFDAGDVGIRFRRALGRWQNRGDRRRCPADSALGRGRSSRAAAVSIAWQD